jgi:hypothetical protein
MSRGTLVAAVVTLVMVAGAARVARRHGGRGLTPHPPGSALVSDGEYVPAFDHDLPTGGAGYHGEP